MTRESGNTGAGESVATENPFFVLDLPTTASAKDIARQKQKLLGMLKLGISSAQQYNTPLGQQDRSEDRVRRAASSLDDARTRLSWELWASGPSDDTDDAPESDGQSQLYRALGLHYQFLRNQTSFATEDFDALGTAWDAVADSAAFFDEVSARAAVLQLGDPSSVADEFLARVIADLVLIIDTAPPFDLSVITSEIAREAILQCGQRKTELLESGCHRLIDGTRDQRRLLYSWGDLQSQYRDIVLTHGDDMRGMAFHSLNVLLSDFAVDIHREGLYSIAEALFLWLRDEAKAVGDEESFTLNNDNLRIATASRKQQESETASAQKSATFQRVYVAAVIVCALAYAFSIFTP